MSKRHFLEFEQPIADLESKIDELRYVQNESAVDISEEIDRLSKKSQKLTADIYAKLSAWQISQVARHPQRPYTLDYISGLFTDFQELHGDRGFADDPAIVGCHQLGLSEDAFAQLGVDNGHPASICQAEPATSIPALHRKIAGERLSREDFRAIVRDIAEHRYSKIELTA